MINKMAQEINRNARVKGFWPEETDRQLLYGIKMALISSESAEALESLRSYNTDHVGEELADIIIRTLDLAYEMGFTDMEAIIEDKMARNTERPFRHNKAF